GARGRGVFVALPQLASCDLDVRARFLTGGPRFESDSRHRSDGGKRFASKAQSGDRKQILDVAELTSGVTLECEKRVVAHHSATIIGDANQSAPAAVDFDSNLCRARIE